MKKIMAFILAILCSFIAGCSADTIEINKENTASVKQEKEENKITYKYLNGTNNKKDQNGKQLIKWSYSYPVFSFTKDKTTCDKINKLINTEIDEYEKSVVKDNEFLFDKNTDISTMMGLPYGGYDEITVKRCDKKIISLQLAKYFFSGGAHGNYSYRGITIDAATGDKVSFEDLADDSNKLYDETSSYLGTLGTDKSYSSKAISDVDYDTHNFVSDNKWYLSRSGIVFMTNPYDAACFAEGSVEYTVPYENVNVFKKSYDYDGSYELHSRADYAVNKDINGDGTDENILMRGRNSERICLVINDNSYNEPFADINNDNVECLNYYIVDLDKKDNYKEIAVEVTNKTSFINYRANLNHFTGRTYFFRYKNEKNIENVGYIDKLLSDSSVDYADEKLKKYVHTTNPDEITVDEGKQIIKDKDKNYDSHYTIEYTTEFKAEQFGIPEKTYAYYSYAMAEGPAYMFGVKSKNLYIGPTNGDLYFDLMKDGKAVKKYEYVKKN